MNEFGYCGDCHGPVELHQWCCGFYIGYIDAEGLAWESRAERDLTIGACTWHEEWQKWARCGGLVGPEPQPTDFFSRCDILPENQNSMVHDCWDMTHDLTSDMKEAMAAEAAPNN